MNFNNRASVKHASGPIAATHSLDPFLAGVAKHYFDLDLARVPEMSDEEVGQIADRAREMKRLRKLLPILEKHFQMLIEGQVEYEQFIAGVQKEVEKGAKKIDKAVLDAWLLSQGYQKHLKLMAQKAQNGLSLIDQQFSNAMTESVLDFKSAMAIAAYRHQLRAQGIQNKLPIAIEREQLAAAERQQNEYRKNLWLFGSKAQNNGGGGKLVKRGGLSGLWDFFTGNSR